MASQIIKNPEPQRRRYGNDSIVPHDTDEYKALMSLYYNNPDLIGHHLLHALATGNRAEAWCEIRYDSNWLQTSRNALLQVCLKLLNAFKHRTIAPPRVIGRRDKSGPAGRDIRSRLTALCAVAALLCANAALALDCTKTDTPAKAVICSSPELQRLDGEVSVLYHKALKESSSPGTVRAGQREWLNARDIEVAGGAGADALKEIYRTRIKGLRCELLAEKLGNAPLPKFKTAPVYPDVWGYLPNPKGPDLIGGALLPDGDVGLDLLDEKEGRVDTKRFFFHRPLTHEDRCRIRLNVGGGFLFHATLADGRIITMVGGGDWTPQTHCYLGPTTYATVYSDTPARAGRGTPIEKTFLYVLDKPRRVENGNICESNPSEHFDLRVRALPLLQFMPLPDGSFLVMSLGGPEVGYPSFVLRFNSHFQTKSQILKGKLFVVDTAKLNRWLSHADFGNDELMQRGLLRWLTVKKPGRK
ncbi:MAG: lysozyme inhibitor LprI family protein [Acidiferrobacteraceae bacterium]